MLFRFKDGLKTLGFLDAVKARARALRRLFTYEPALLTADIVAGLSAIAVYPGKQQMCH